MKTRNGFVSNSSSTSFIVRKDRKEEAIKGLELISVSDIRKWAEQGTKLGIDFYDVTGNLIFEIRHLKDGDYITKPYDRDRAYEEGVDFQAFQSDI
jgi:hypothetical protein